MDTTCFCCGHPRLGSFGYGSEQRLAHFKEGKWKREANATPERHAIQLALYEYDGKFMEEKAKREAEECEQQREVDANKDKGKSR